MSYGWFISGTILHKTLYNMMIISNGSVIGISYIRLHLYVQGCQLILTKFPEINLREFSHLFLHVKNNTEKGKLEM